jgi:hypothetical protein
MKKILFLFILLLVYGSVSAQIRNFIDPNFKNKLLQSSPSNFIAQNLNGNTTTNRAMTLSQATLYSQIYIIATS